MISAFKYFIRYSWIKLSTFLRRKSRAYYQSPTLLTCHFHLNPSGVKNKRDTRFHEGGILFSKWGLHSPKWETWFPKRGILFLEKKKSTPEKKVLSKILFQKKIRFFWETGSIFKKTGSPIRENGFLIRETGSLSFFWQKSSLLQKKSRRVSYSRNQVPYSENRFISDGLSSKS